MKCLVMFVCVVTLTAPVWGALDDPAISDPSFENSTWDDSWINRTSYFSIDSDTQETIPETPFGEYWVKFGNSSWLFQQIGTWESDMPLDISLISGKEAGKNYGGLVISLWAGGDPSLAADAGDNNIPPTNLADEVGAVKIAESDQFDYPNGDDMGTFDVEVTLNTGTDGVVGDPLWLLVQSAGRQKVLVDNIQVEYPVTAMLVGPENEGTLVSTDADLEWGPPEVGTVQKYILTYRQNDPNFSEPGSTIVDPATAPYDLGTMPNNTTYFWKVDIVNDAGETITGRTWNFTTAPAIPVVIQEPQSILADVGGEATFSVEATNAETIKWFQYVDGTADNDVYKATGQSFTISGVDQGNEGLYYATVSNDASLEGVRSQNARLMTKRLVAHWDFEGDLLDEVAGFEGVLTDPNIYNNIPPTAAYVTGPAGVGQALSLSNNTYVKVQNSTDAFNFYPTGFSISAWVKKDGGGYCGYVAKNDRIMEPQQGFGLYQQYNNAGVILRGAGNLYAPNGTAVNDDAWHLAVGTYNAQTGRLAVYVDGKLTGEQFVTGTPLENDSPLLIGVQDVRDTGDLVWPFNGVLDDVMIYSYALDPVDIAALYTQTMGGTICVDDEGLEYDLNDDCAVDIADLALFVDEWLNCRIVPDCID